MLPWAELKKGFEQGLCPWLKTVNEPEPERLRQNWADWIMEINVSREKKLFVIVVSQSGNLLPGPSEERRHGGARLGVLGDRTERMLQNSHALVPRSRLDGAKLIISITSSHPVIPS